MRPIKDFTIFDDFFCCPLGAKETDLDDFIHDDARGYYEREEAVTYGLFYDMPENELKSYPLGFATLQQDTIQIESKKIPDKNMPAVKIARFGIRREFHGLDFGSTFLAMISQLMSHKGWRFITLNIYCRPVVRFYEKNNFIALGGKPAKLKPAEQLTMYLDMWKPGPQRDPLKKGRLPFLSPKRSL